MKRIFLLVFFVIFAVLMAEDVVLNVNMSYQDSLGNFDPAVDYVDVAGNFNDWNGSGAMEDPESDGIYTITVPDLEVGFLCEYKFRINGDWNTSEFPGGGGNRSYTVVAGENIVDHWYNDEEPALIFVDVVFTIEDGTELYEDIKFKSSFDEWLLHPMADDGVAPDETAGDHIWTVLVEDIPNGTWEWGAIEDDGSQWGIWLIEGDNLLVTIDGEGNVSGQTEYFIDPGSVQEVTVTFQLDASLLENVGEITIAGDFNGWETAEDVMIYDEAEGLWLIDVVMPVGSQINQEYKYLNDGVYEDIENRMFTLDDSVTEQVLPVDYFNNMDPADYLEQSMTLTINVDVEDTVFDSIALCGNVAPLDWDFELHNYPLSFVGDNIWTIDVTFMEGSYRYLQFKFATDGADNEAGFDENHTHTLDESDMAETIWCVYGEMGPVMDNDENYIPQSVVLLRNYPNPFNPETTISWQLPEDVQGELAVYNLKGQLVKSWNGIEGTGNVAWKGIDSNGSPVSSGIYLAIVKAGELKQTSKMIMLK